MEKGRRAAPQVAKVDSAAEIVKAEETCKQLVSHPAAVGPLESTQAIQRSLCQVLTPEVSPVQPEASVPLLPPGAEFDVTSLALPLASIGTRGFELTASQAQQALRSFKSFSQLSPETSKALAGIDVLQVQSATTDMLLYVSPEQVRQDFQHLTAALIALAETPKHMESMFVVAPELTQRLAVYLQALVELPAELPERQLILAKASAGIREASMTLEASPFETESELPISTIGNIASRACIEPPRSQLAQVACQLLPLPPTQTTSLIQKGVTDLCTAAIPPAMPSELQVTKHTVCDLTLPATRETALVPAKKAQVIAAADGVLQLLLLDSISGVESATVLAPTTARTTMRVLRSLQTGLMEVLDWETGPFADVVMFESHEVSVTGGAIVSTAQVRQDVSLLIQLLWARQTSPGTVVLLEPAVQENFTKAVRRLSTVLTCLSQLPGQKTDVRAFDLRNAIVRGVRDAAYTIQRTHGAIAASEPTAETTEAKQLAQSIASVALLAQAPKLKSERQETLQQAILPVLQRRALPPFVGTGPETIFRLRSSPSGRPVDVTPAVLERAMSELTLEASTVPTDEQRVKTNETPVIAALAVATADPSRTNTLFAPLQRGIAESSSLLKRVFPAPGPLETSAKASRSLVRSACLSTALAPVTTLCTSLVPVRPGPLAVVQPSTTAVVPVETTAITPTFEYMLGHHFKTLLDNVVVSPMFERGELRAASIFVPPQVVGSLAFLLEAAEREAETLARLLCRTTNTCFEGRNLLKAGQQALRAIGGDCEENQMCVLSPGGQHKRKKEFRYGIGATLLLVLSSLTGGLLDDKDRVRVYWDGNAALGEEGAVPESADHYGFFVGVDLPRIQEAKALPAEPETVLYGVETPVETTARVEVTPITNTVVPSAAETVPPMRQRLFELWKLLTSKMALQGLEMPPPGVLIRMTAVPKPVVVPAPTPPSGLAVRVKKVPHPVGTATKRGPALPPATAEIGTVTEPAPVTEEAATEPVAEPKRPVLMDQAVVTEPVAEVRRTKHVLHEAPRETKVRGPTLPPHVTVETGTATEPTPTTAEMQVTTEPVELFTRGTETEPTVSTKHVFHAAPQVTTLQGPRVRPTTVETGAGPETAAVTTEQVTQVTAPVRTRAAIAVPAERVTVIAPPMRPVMTDREVITETPAVETLGTQVETPTLEAGTQAQPVSATVGIQSVSETTGIGIETEPEPVAVTTKQATQATAPVRARAIFVPTERLTVSVPIRPVVETTGVQVETPATRAAGVQVRPSATTAATQGGPVITATVGTTPTGPTTATVGSQAGFGQGLPPPPPTQPQPEPEPEPEPKPKPQPEPEGFGLGLLPTGPPPPPPPSFGPGSPPVPIDLLPPSPVIPAQPVPVPTPTTPATPALPTPTPAVGPAGPPTPHAAGTVAGFGPAIGGLAPPVRPVNPPSAAPSVWQHGHYATVALLVVSTLIAFR
ncbi:MAG: hypothetical protein MHM6MM_001323 [Cercozoa sp. M6MM]